MSNGNTLDIAAQAKTRRRATCRESGLLKVKQGVTSLEEIEAVANADPASTATETARRGTSLWQPPRKPGRAARPTRPEVKANTVHREGTDRAARRCAAKCALPRKPSSPMPCATGHQRSARSKRTFKGGGKISEKEIALFTRQLATMTRAGVLLQGVRHRRAEYRQQSPVAPAP